MSVTTVIVDKLGKPVGYDVFEWAWMTLFQRFENTLRYGNFPGAHANDHGMVLTDATNGKFLTRLVRRMAVHNYVPNQAGLGAGSRNLPIVRIIEDPNERNSIESLPIQMCDVAAYFAQQKYAPNSYVKKQHAHHYYDRLGPVLNRRASRSNGLGIVML